MSVHDEIKLDLARAREAERMGNQGKARTSARRAVGAAISELQKLKTDRKYGSNVMEQLRSLESDTAIPEPVRGAAYRLQAKLSPDFDSPSKHPIEDAGIIIEYVLGLLMK